MLDPLEWNSLETCRNIAKVSMLYIITHNLVAINPDFYISSQTSLTRQSVFDTSPLAHPLTTSNSASSLIQLSFGMHYHLIVSLLLLWISLNHRSKPTTTKQFSIIYVNRLLFLNYLLIVNIWSVHADA